MFGISAFIYRIFLYTGIILIIYHKFTKAIVLVMMVLELYSILIYPFYRVTLTFDGDAPFDYGRVVHISVPHRERFYSRVRAYLISTFRREF